MGQSWKKNAHVHNLFWIAQLEHIQYQNPSFLFFCKIPCSILRHPWDVLRNCAAPQLSDAEDSVEAGIAQEKAGRLFMVM